MTALLLAFGAGALTTLNPCVLPLLPIVFASAMASGRMGSVALLAGLVAGFATLGLVVNATGSLFGFDDRILRSGIAILLVLFGIILLTPSLERRFTAVVSPTGVGGAELASRVGNHGVIGQFGVGLLLGVIWAPCSGPSLGVAFALAAEASSYPQAVLRMIFFTLGTASVLLLLVTVERALIARRRETLQRMARLAKPILATAFLLVGIAVLTGVDKQIETLLNDLAPEWLVTLTTSL